MASKSVKKKAEKTLDAAESLIKKSTNKAKSKDERKITSQSKKLTEKQGKGVSVVEGEGVKTIKNWGKAKKDGENIRSKRKSETKDDTKADTKSKKYLPVKYKNIEKTLGRKLTKKEIAGLVSAGLLTTGTASLLSPVKAKDKTTEGKKKTTTKTETEIRGKKRRVGKFAPRFRPFKGKLAKLLLGEDEQFGGGKGGLLDPNLGMGVRRGGRSVATTTTTKDKDGNVISKNTKIKRLNPEVSAKKDRKDPPKKNMGGMMKAKGKANGGAMKKKGYAAGGSVRKMSDGGDVLSKSKVVKLSKVAKALIEKGLRKVKAEKEFTGKQIQEARKEINRMTGVSSTKGAKTPKEKMLSSADFRAIEKSSIPTANQRKEMSRRRNEERLAEGKANGGMMKKKGYAKGGMAKKGSAKGGAATKVKRTSKRKSSMGAATRGGGAIMR
tara:strand:- start:881 stop:2197 length:1317 start_codon:yes stop_codon:yes gene_type:complete